MTDSTTGVGRCATRTYAARDEDSEGLYAPLLLEHTLTQVVSGGTYVVLATGTVAASVLHYVVLPRGYDTPSPEAVVTKTVTAAVATGEYSLSRAAAAMELGIGGLSPDTSYSVYCVAALGSHVGVAQAYVTALDVQTTVPTAPTPTITVTRGTHPIAATEGHRGGHGVCCCFPSRTCVHARVESTAIAWVCAVCVQMTGPTTSLTEAMPSTRPA